MWLKFWNFQANLIISTCIFSIYHKNCVQVNVWGAHGWLVIKVSVMAWCLQARNHYLNQFWPRSMTPWSMTKGSLGANKFVKIFIIHLTFWHWSVTLSRIIWLNLVHCWFALWRPYHWRYFDKIRNSTKIVLWFKMYSISHKFFTRHDSVTVVTCAKFCCDQFCII